MTKHSASLSLTPASCTLTQVILPLLIAGCLQAHSPTDAVRHGFHSDSATSLQESLLKSGANMVTLKLA